MSTLATVRGLSIASAFFLTGSFTSSSLVVIPSILLAADYEAVDARMLARQYAIGDSVGLVTQAPLELLTTFTFGFLAWHSRSTSTDSLSWKLYAGASAAVFSIIPYTIIFMKRDSLKLVSMAEQPTSHVMDKEPKLEHGDSLALPPQTAVRSITPVEEFEPYDDSPFSGAEYEKLKVKKLLQKWGFRNTFRILAAALCGGLAMAAITTRVTLVTIVQGP